MAFEKIFLQETRGFKLQAKTNSSLRSALDDISKTVMFSHKSNVENTEEKNGVVPGQVSIR